MKSALEGYLANLSGLLLGVGVGCFLRLLPFPPLFWTSDLPGAWLFYCGGGRGFLCVGGLIRLGVWCSRRIAHSLGALVPTDGLGVGRHD
ncbi:MAG TPA: hypothetical protein VFV38_39785 [Ktedonobacteraceae bacterium]|nr:hypothetical protein [Ktedonobacteraceae bacterium]